MARYRIKFILDKLKPRSKVVRGMGVLSGGVVAAHLLIVLSSPVLTRLYTPEEFGVLGVYASVLSVFAVVASFRYEIAMPAVIDDVNASNLLALCLLLATALSVVIFVILCVFSEELISLLGRDGEYVIWMLPVGVFFAGIFKSLNFYSIRLGQYGQINKAKLGQTIGLLAFQVFGANLGSLGLILGHVCGQGLGSNFLYKGVSSVFKKQEVTLSRIKGVAMQYADYPKYSTFSSLFNTFGSQFPPVAFALIFSPAVAGMYVLASRVIFVPITLVSNTLTSVLFSEGRRYQEKGELGEKLWIVHLFLSNISLPFVVVLTLLLPELFSTLFGEDWKESGEYAQLMMPWVYFVFVITPALSVYEMYGSRKKTAIYQAVLLMLRLFGIAFGAYMSSVVVAISSFSILSAVICFGFFIIVAVETGVSVKNILTGYMSLVFWALFCLSPVVMGWLFSACPREMFAYIVMSLLLVFMREIYIFKIFWKRFF